MHTRLLLGGHTCVTPLHRLDLDILLHGEQFLNK